MGDQVQVLEQKVGNKKLVSMPFANPIRRHIRVENGNDMNKRAVVSSSPWHRQHETSTWFDHLALQTLPKKRSNFHWDFWGPYFFCHQSPRVNFPISSPPLITPFDLKRIT
ncbi:hypothetical protein QJS10_CPB14g00927 [Acorus calamus]|uniref:Uncharacterized protein n=1 Tax=Acorus calamus TaxID=4465 RepID=A0AAV9DF46_ACOCL|nr:hypothetical protein QJS10_CPB14g00927 [Acorus calamus]